jgi:hypothetical protein
MEQLSYKPNLKLAKNFPFNFLPVFLLREHCLWEVLVSCKIANDKHGEEVKGPN